MVYDEINEDQVASSYKLFRFLEKLKVIGHLKVHTVQRHTEEVNGECAFGNYIMYAFSEDRYSLVKDAYYPQARALDAVEMIEQILNREYKKFNPLL